MNPEDRRKIMARCYMDATKRLRNAFHAEFHGLLQEEYEMAGVDIRQRLTPQMKLERDIAAARALLAEHGIDS
jgi:hypothetical protein